MLREGEVDDPNDMERAASGLIRLTCLAILAGAATGLVAAIFRIVLALGDRWVAEAAALARDPDHGLAILMTMIAAMLGLAVWAVFRFSPETAGSGIPHVEKVIEGTALAGGLRLLVVKFVGGALAMSGGLALGREGPSVQMGASLAHLTARTFRISWADQRILIAACAGAGLTAAFSAPIAGAVFVLEELVRRFETRLAICALMASAAAVTVTGQIIGPGPELPADLVAQAGSFAHPFFVLFGLVAGAFALVYNRLLILAIDAMERIPLSPVLRAAVIGLGVGALIWSAPHIVGPGDNLVRSAMRGDEALHWLPLLLVFRLGFSVLSYAVGTPGGIFAPLLVLGAELGLLFGLALAQVLPEQMHDPRTFAVAGMAAVFTGVVRAPLTGIVIVTEMTGTTALLLPIMVSCASAMLVATIARSRPIYDVLRERSGTRVRERGAAAPPPAPPGPPRS